MRLYTYPVALIVFFVVYSPLFSIVYASDVPEHVPGEWLVRFEAKPNIHILRADLPEAAQIRLSASGLANIQFKKDLPIAAVRALLKQRGMKVRYVQPNYIKHVKLLPSDLETLYSQQWAHSADNKYGLHTPAAWDRTTGNHSIVVAVIDTGIDDGYPELAGNIWRNPGEIAGNGLDDDNNGYIDDVMGWDFIDGDNAPYEVLHRQENIDDVHIGTGHGTQMSAVIGAEADDGGMVGTAWNVQIMVLRAFDAHGAAKTDNLAAAIDYAIKNGADIINASYGERGPAQIGLPGFDNIEYEAMEAALDADVLVSTTACNDDEDNDNNSKGPCLPAGYSLDNIIAVASSDNKGDLASNWGPGSGSGWGKMSIDLAAPGQDIVTVGSSVGIYPPKALYVSVSGTSVSAAFVSGAAALMLSETPGATAVQLKHAMLSTVTKTTGLEEHVRSGGVLNIDAAMTWLASGNSADVVSGEYSQNNNRSTTTVVGGGGGLGLPGLLMLIPCFIRGIRSQCANWDLI